MCLASTAASAANCSSGMSRSRPSSHAVPWPSPTPRMVPACSRENHSTVGWITAPGRGCDLGPPHRHRLAGVALDAHRGMQYPRVAGVARRHQGSDSGIEARQLGGDPVTGRDVGEDVVCLLYQLPVLVVRGHRGGSLSRRVDAGGPE